MASWVAVAVPLAAAALLSVGWRGTGRRAHALLFLVALATGAITIAAALPLAGSTAPMDAAGARYIAVEMGPWFELDEWRATLDLRLDPLSALTLLAITVLFAATHLHLTLRPRSESVRPPPAGSPATFAWLLVLAAVLVLTDDIFLLLVCWQLVGLCGQSLQEAPRDPAAAVARHTGLLYRIGSAALLLAIVVLVWEFGSLRLTELMTRASIVWLPGQPKAILVAFLLGIAGASRLAVIPVHGSLSLSWRCRWSARGLAGNLLPVLGLYVLLRSQVVLVLGSAALAILAGLAAVTVLSATLTSAVAMEPRRVLSYAAVAQGALAVVGLATGVFAASWAHIVVTALVFLLLQQSLDLVERAQMSVVRGPSLVPDTAPLWSERPRLAAILTLAALAWVGLPFLTPAAVTRATILWRAAQPPTGNASLWLVMAVAGGITAYAGMRWLLVVVNTPVRAAPPRRSPAGSLVAASLVAATIVLLATSGLVDQIATGSGPQALGLTSPTARAWSSSAETDAVPSGLMRGMELALAVAGVVAAAVLWRHPATRTPAVVARLGQLAAAGWHLEPGVAHIGRRALMSCAHFLRPRSASLPGSSTASASSSTSAARFDLQPGTVLAMLAVPAAVAVATTGVDPSVVITILVGLPWAVALTSLGVELVAARRWALLGALLHIGLLLAAARRLVMTAASRADALTLVAWPVGDSALLEIDGFGVVMLLGISMLAAIAAAAACRCVSELRWVLVMAALLSSSIMSASLLLTWSCWLLATTAATMLLHQSGPSASEARRFASRTAAALGVVGLATVALSVAPDVVASSPDGAVPWRGILVWMALAGWLALAGIGPLRAGATVLLCSSGLAAGLSGLVWWLAAMHALVRHSAAGYPGWWADNGVWIAAIGVVCAIGAPLASLTRPVTVQRLATLPGFHAGLALIGLAVWTRPGIVGAIAVLVAGAGATAGLRLLAELSSAEPTADPLAAAELRPGPDPSVASKALWLAATAGPASLGLLGTFFICVAAMPRFGAVVLLVAIATVVASYAGVQALRLGPPVAPPQTLLGPPTGAIADTAPAGLARGGQALVALLAAVVVTLGVMPQPLLHLAHVGARRLLAVEVRLEPADPEIGSSLDRRVTSWLPSTLDPRRQPNRWRRKNPMLAGRSANRRMNHGYQLGP